MLDDEVSLQLEAIQDMLVALPKAIRDQMEQIIELNYNTYKQ